MKKRKLNKLTNDLKNNFKEFKELIPTFKEDPTKEIKSFEPKKAPKKFLDKKRIIIFGLMIILAIVLIIITVIFVTNVNVATIVHTVSEIKDHTPAIIAGWILLLIFGSLVRLMWQIESIRMRFKHHFIKVKPLQWINFGILAIFINTITIFALGSDPYKMWWMTKKGLKLYEANAIILSSGWIIQLTQMIISYPSLAFVIYYYFFSNGEFVHSYNSYVAMILVCAGYCNDIVVFIAISILGYSMKTQLVIANIFNWIRKKIGLTYKSKEVIKEEFITKSKFQKAFIQEMKCVEANFYIVFWTVGALLMYYFSMFFAYELVVPYYPSEKIHIIANTFWSTYNFSNVATVANNFIPIPGSEGTLQFVLISFFNSLLKNPLTNSDNNWVLTIKQTVFIWRSFNYYLLIIFGAIYSIILGITISIKKHLNKKELIKKSWFQLPN